MTRKLEELFDLPPTAAEVNTALPQIPITQEAIQNIDETIDKIDAALPIVNDLNTSDNELDDLAKKAEQSFDDLMSLGMNVDSRFAAEIFATAGTMLGHALTAKTAKLNKKLKMIDLQLKKAKLDQQSPEEPTVPTGTGHVLDRNELLEKLIGDRRTNAKKE